MMGEEGADAAARRLIGAALNLPHEQIPETARIYDLLGWDSFGHLMIIQQLEGVFGVSIDDETLFERLSSVEAIAAYIRGRGGVAVSEG